MTTRTITLPFPPPMNNLFANHRQGGRYPTKRYRDWQTAAGWVLQSQRGPQVAGPYSIVFEVGRPDKRRRDLSNLWKAPSDLLVKHGVVEDDSLEQSVEMRWVEGLIGCRITISSQQQKAA